jgi:hypothetical protein
VFRKLYVFRKHYTDEQLLAFLDEGHDTRLTVSTHLQSCWKCRSRLIEVEDQFQTLKSAWRQAMLNRPAEVEEARNRFLAWTSAGSFEFRGRTAWRVKFMSLLRAPIMASVCAMLLFGGVTIWELQQHEDAALPKTRSAAGTARGLDPPGQPVRDVARVVRPVVRPMEPVELPPIRSTRLQSTRRGVTQLSETEVAVWWLLHRAGACHGEPVEIRVTDEDRIVISGIVPTRGRRKELDATLEGINHRDLIRIEIESAEDFPPRSGATPLTRLPVLHSGPPPELSEFQIAAAKVLRGMYPDDTPAETRKRLVEIANRAIRGSEDAIGEALAIRRLGDRFHARAEHNLPAQSRQWLEIMAREHLLALHSHLMKLGNLLAPILSNMASHRATAVASLDLSAAVERLRVLVQGSLLGNSSSLGSTAEVSREIVDLSEFLLADLSDPDSAAVRVFSTPLTALRPLKDNQR